MKPRCSSIAFTIAAIFSTTPAIAAPDKSSTPMIVVFQSETPFQQFQGNARADERSAAHPDAWNYVDRGVLGAVQRLEGRHRFKSKHVFSHATKGFAVELTPEQIEALRAEPTIAYIEADQPMSLVAQSLPWGVNRVEADRSSTLAGNGSGAISNVNVYVIDTGIARHRDLNLVGQVNFAGGTNSDCNGHGTHVAGSIGALDDYNDVVGVAPGVRLIGVKVLDCYGNGTSSGVIKAVDWVTANAVKPAVANMSLGGGASQALDDAVKRSVRSNVFYAVAAGNSGVDACTGSPARIGFNDGGLDNGIVTTAATDAYNREPSWSNYGRCVNIWSPGVNIVSTSASGGLTSMSGTSMATPHTAGAAALFLSRNPGAAPATVEAALRSYSIYTGTTSKDGRAIQLLQTDRF